MQTQTKAQQLQQQQESSESSLTLSVPLAAVTTTTTTSNQQQQQQQVVHLQTDSSSSLHNNNNNNTTDKDETTTTAASLQQQEQQLSTDLAQFLANPSLRAALADGSLDLASYSTQVEDELAVLEAACIQIYRDHQAVGTITALTRHLQECQAVLAALQEMLLGFQADLGGLSGEIRQLQAKSRTLDVQLKNRKQAEGGLRDFLQHVVVAPALAHTITTGRVNPTFLQAVQELNQIYRHIYSEQPQAWACDKAPTETAAGQEMQSHVETLRFVAASRVRDYFLQQLALLRRSPQTNVRMIQVHGLVKYAALQDFLQEACPEIATEIFNVYTECMSKTLQQLFRTYQAQLLQLDATKSAATRQDVIAMDDALLRDTLTTRAKKRVDVFCLGRRAVECLEEPETAAAAAAAGSSSGGVVVSTAAARATATVPSTAAAAAPHAQRRSNATTTTATTTTAAVAVPMTLPQPILAHVALAENQRYPYERLFRSLLGHLVDAVTNEHVFCRQFFKRDAFNVLFNGTLSLLLEQLENYLFGCYDALCLLLMIKVTHSYKRLARHRRIHSLDPFFVQITKLIWPRLKIVMDGHLRSLQQATAIKLGGVDLHAHYTSRRFAEFACSILLILQNNSSKAATATTPKIGGSTAAAATTTDSKQEQQQQRQSSRRTSSFNTTTAMDEMAGMSAGEKLLEDLSEMINEYLVLLDRLADEHSSQKKKIVFTINNLDQVVSIFQERRVVGEEFNKFVEQLMRQREYFVEVELLTGFSKMIAFVQQTEQDMQAVPRGSYEVNIQEVESLVLDFASNWKSNIEQINRNVLSYFSNFRNGMEILKQCLTQLLLYYTRFQDIIRKVWRNKPPAFCKDLVSTTVILAEIKKYALAI